MIDAGVVVYVGLFVLAIWRYASMWRLCGNALVWANYCVLGYIFFLVLLIIAVWYFVAAAIGQGGRNSWDQMPGWMHGFLLGAPVAACISYALNATQTVQHVNEIRKDIAVLKHDRVVQIIALPAVYGVMAMSSLARMYEFTAVRHVAPENHTEGDLERTARHAYNDDLEQYYISRSEACFWVGDLYEAWALYLFGLLTLDLIKESLNRRLRGTETERHEAAIAYAAVEKIAWLGVTLFLVVCVLQAGWSLYLLTFTQTDFAMFNTRMSQFRAAGMVASAGAIYNVHTVETTFHNELSNYKPLLKFITVKIIVSLAFFQRQTISVLKVVQGTFPGVVQRFVRAIPLFGDLMDMDDVKFTMFYDALILYECILISILHWWGWSAYEEWYHQFSEEDEKTPLMAPAGSGDSAPSSSTNNAV